MTISSLSRVIIAVPLYIALMKARIFLEVIAIYKGRDWLKVLAHAETTTKFECCELGKSHRYTLATTIGMLPDIVLLEIVDFLKIGETYHCLL